MSNLHHNGIHGTSISMSIMSHPKRAGLLKSLLELLDRDELSKLTIHTETPPYFWDVAKKCWEDYDPNASHHFVLCDDGHPCKNIIKSLKVLCSIFPDVAIMPYANQKVIEEAYSAGHNLATIKGGCWGTGFLMPTKWIPFFLSWEKRIFEPSYKHDDVRISVFLLTYNLPSYATVPSLIEHVAPSESMLGQPNRTRVARVWKGFDFDAMSIDWSKMVGIKQKTGRISFIPSMTNAYNNSKKLNIPWGNSTTQ